MLRGEESVAGANALLGYADATNKMTLEQARDPDTGAVQTAYKMLRLYVPPAGAAGKARLPLPLQTGGPTGDVVPNRAWAIEVINQLTGSDAEKARLLAEFDAYARVPQGQQELRALYGRPEEVPVVPGFIGPLPMALPLGSVTPSPAPGASPSPVQSSQGKKPGTVR
jgi:hypothetical protein